MLLLAVMLSLVSPIWKPSLALQLWASLKRGSKPHPPERSPAVLGPVPGAPCSFPGQTTSGGQRGAKDGAGSSFCFSRESGEAAACLGLLQGDVCQQGKAAGEWSWRLWWVTVLVPWSEGISCRAWLSHCSLLPEEYFQSKSHHCSLY